MPRRRSHRRRSLEALEEQGNIAQKLKLFSSSDANLRGALLQVRCRRCAAFLCQGDALFKVGAVVLTSPTLLAEKIHYIPQEMPVSRKDLKIVGTVLCLHCEANLGTALAMRKSSLGFVNAVPFVCFKTQSLDFFDETDRTSYTCTKWAECSFPIHAVDVEAAEEAEQLLKQSLAASAAAEAGAAEGAEVPS